MEATKKMNAREAKAKLMEVLPAEHHALLEAYVGAVMGSCLHLGTGSGFYEAKRQMFAHYPDRSKMPKDMYELAVAFGDKGDERFAKADEATREVF